jgi:hypothetical protein
MQKHSHIILICLPLEPYGQSKTLPYAHLGIKFPCPEDENGAGDY